MEKFIQDTRRIALAGIRGARPDVLFQKYPPSTWLPPLEQIRHLYVVGAGKAAMAMAGVLEDHLERPVDEGLVVVPHGYAATYPTELPPPSRIDVAEAGHPVPDASGIHAARAILRLLSRTTSEDLVLVLLSGGGSSLLPAFADDISLEDARETFRLLLHSGATIHEINTVRKHISLIGGGRLALHAAPAQVRTLVISDVVGDDLSVIASGPTVPDPTTFQDALDILTRYNLLERLPHTVRTYLEEALQHPEWETPKPGHPAFRHVHNILIGRNTDALEAAREEALRLGYDTTICSHTLQGEAREVARTIVRHAYEKALPDEPICFLWGGETTVTVRGKGRGGRNQELALGAVLALRGKPDPLVVLSINTDGIDGPTDAAGAWATPDTYARALRMNLNPEHFLENNDSYTFFSLLRMLMKTGPTHTNVMDLIVALGRIRPLV